MRRDNSFASPHPRGSRASGEDQSMTNKQQAVSDADRRRFESYVDRQGADECWPWRGKPNRKGYGSLSIDNRVRRATHIALILDGRPRPSPKHGACHSCDNPPCVNPAHLWWGTQRDNLRDAAAKGRTQSGPRPHCKRNHPMAGDNLGIDRSGYRYCRACLRLRAAKYRRGEIANG